MAEALDSDLMEHLMGIFADEAREHVDAIGTGLLDLEKVEDADQSKTIIETLYREAHSLKGAARSVDLGSLENVCQTFEDRFAELKRGDAVVTSAFLDTLHGHLRAIEETMAKAMGSDAENTGERDETETDTSEATAAEGELLNSVEAVVSDGMPETGLTTPAAAAGQTVRIATAKLDALLTRSEELLRVRMACEQRVSQARELHRVTDDWARHLRQKGRFGGLGFGSGSGSDATGVDAGPDAAAGGKDSFFGVFQDSVDRLCRAMADDRRLVDSLVDQLLEQAKSVMMLPFSTITKSLPRQARSIADDVGKHVRCEVVGDHLEIDKRILEEFHDVLIHLLRNAVDHGIETPERRATAGKPVQGAVTLSITQQTGNSVEITVEDDGAGIDTADLRGAALKSGVVLKGDLTGDTDQELLPLIFESGVSTSPILSKLSGRGLGMAIVRDKVEELGGSVSVSTAVGQGTCFTVVLPTLLSTYHGVLVRSAGQSFVVSTSGLDRVMRVRREDIRMVANRETVQVGGRPLAFAQLSDLLGLRAKGTVAGEWLNVVVVASTGQKLALGVDEIVGEEEILSKNLGSQLRRVRNVSAATVLASGKIVLVLNVSDLIRSSARLGRAAPQADEAPGAGSEREPSRILLVEDSITARVLLQNILESAGYTVTTAVDGAEGFTTVRSEPFDLVVSDVEMPRMNGFELTQRIREEERLADLPVILVTARETREDRERGIDAGANAYLGKSNFDQTDLLHAIERLI